MILLNLQSDKKRSLTADRLNVSEPTIKRTLKGVSDQIEAIAEEESGLPESFKVAARRGRPSKTNPKVSTTIRFDADIIEAFKLKGAGWQSRMNDALRDWLKTHSAT